MTTKFTLNIRLGNDLMRTGSDIARALRKVSESERLAYIEPIDENNDFVGGMHGLIIDENGAHVGRFEIAEQKTGEQIAREVLDNHAIRDDWRRTGEQIIGLIDEAVRIARGEEGRVTWP